MNRISRALRPGSLWLSLGPLAAAIFMGFNPSVKAQTFSDIQGHWAEGCIDNLAAREIISGYPDNTFKPRNIVTRAEYAAMVDQAFEDIAAERDEMNFTDVSGDYWAQTAIQATYQKGFLSGYPNGEFRPDDIIEQQEAYVAFASGLDYEIPENPEQILRATYEEPAEIDDYAAGKIAAATENGIVISPPKPQFDQRIFPPDDPVTRGQVAAAICQIKNIPGVAGEYNAGNAQQPLANLALAQTLTGHSRGIMSVQVSPDGETLVSGGDTTVKVWDLATGTLEHTLRDHTEWVYSVDISADGQRIASGSIDSTVKIWNLQTGELLHDLTGHSDSVIDIDISPNGGLVASASDDQTVKLWDLGTGNLLRTFAGHTDPVNAVAISPDGETIISGSFDDTIKVWNWRRTEGSELLRTLPGHSGGVHALAIASNGQTLFSGGEDGTIKIWNLATGDLQQTLASNSSRVNSLALSPDHQTLASAGLGGTIQIWDVSAQTVIETVSGIASPALDIGPDGTLLVSGNGSPIDVNEEVEIRVWEAQ